MSGDNPHDRAAQLDQVSDRIAITSLEVEFPGWLLYRGTDNLCHARRHQDETHIRGEDWVDLRDQIVREIGRSEQ